jgi:hypothetical protein
MGIQGSKTGSKDGDVFQNHSGMDHFLIVGNHIMKLMKKKKRPLVAYVTIIMK